MLENKEDLIRLHIAVEMMKIIPAKASPKKKTKKGKEQQKLSASSKAASPIKEEVILNVKSPASISYRILKEKMRLIAARQKLKPLDIL